MKLKKIKNFPVFDITYHRPNNKVFETNKRIMCLLRIINGYESNAVVKRLNSD